MENDANYYDIAAQTYDVWFPDEAYEDIEFYRQMMSKVPGPALEVGCGTGRLLLPYLREGFEIDGLDSSDDMLEICRRKAVQQGLNPVLHHQYMQKLDLNRKYATIFVPFGSFMLVTDRADAFETLARFYNHLQPNGQVLITTYLSWGETRFVPNGDLPAQTQKAWTLRRAGVRPTDQAIILVHQAVINNYVEQLQQGWYRYEIYSDGHLKETYLQPMNLRWYSKYELVLMLEKVGFHDITVCGDYSEVEASEGNSVFVYRARK